jgi:hypothetical protein
MSARSTSAILSSLVLLAAAAAFAADAEKSVAEGPCKLGAARNVAPGIDIDTVRCQVAILADELRDAKLDHMSV